MSHQSRTSIDRVDDLLESMLGVPDDAVDLGYQGEDNVEISLCDGLGVFLGALEDRDDIDENFREVELEAGDGREEILGVKDVEVGDLLVYCWRC